MPSLARTPAPIVVRPPPCPCTTLSPGATQEVLSGLLPVIRQQAMQLQSQIMRENTRGVNRRAGRNVRCQHPYAGHKHAQKDSTNGCQPPRKVYVQRFSVQRANVQCPAKQEPSAATSTAYKVSQTKPKKTLAATFCGYPSEDEEDLV